MADFTAFHPADSVRSGRHLGSIGLLTAIGASIALWATIIGTVVALV